jgi:hypothetical protein
MLKKKLPEGIVYKLTDKYELKIYDAIQSMGISQCSRIEVKEVLKSCLQLSGTQSPAISDFEFIVQFVIDNFGIFKLYELKIAFEMLAADKISVDKHIIFNPKLIGEVMSAYKKIAVQVRSKIQIEPKKQIPMQIDEEQVMREEAEYWKTSKKDWRFLNYQCFDYLWKRKLLKITPEKAEFIKSRVKAYHLAQAKKPEDIMVDEETMRQQCKKYSLKLYYDNEL